MAKLTNEELFRIIDIDGFSKNDMDVIKKHVHRDLGLTKATRA
jgi:hypothetical protein